MNATATEVALHDVPEIQSRIEKLNRRAAKLGLAPLTLTVHNERETEYEGEYYSVVDITISGEELKLNGWSFVGTLEHDEDTTIIRALPSFGAEHDLSAYRTASPDHCDHCGYKRRRNDTYLVANDEGEIKQVGSSCLKDFTGHGSPEAIARWIESLADLIDYASNGGSGERGETRIDTVGFMANAAAMIREHGFTSKGKAWETGETPTSQQTINNILDLRAKKDWAIAPTDGDIAVAEATVAWARNLTERELENDYLYNVFAVLIKDSIRWRQAGIAASAIAAYKRDLAQREAAKHSGGFIGEVGATITGHITVSDIRNNVGQFMSTLITMKSDSGDTIKWFASNDPGWQVGEDFNIKAKVKRHEAHDRFGNATLVTHCKEVE